MNKRSTTTGLPSDQCAYCGAAGHSTTLTVDHLVPMNRGGRNTRANRVPSCSRCNLVKANRHIPYLLRDVRFAMCAIHRLIAYVRANLGDLLHPTLHPAQIVHIHSIYEGKPEPIERDDAANRTASECEGWAGKVEFTRRSTIGPNGLVLSPKMRMLLGTDCADRRPRFYASNWKASTYHQSWM